MPDIEGSAGEAEEGSAGKESVESPSPPASLQRGQRGIRRSKISSLMASAGTCSLQTVHEAIAKLPWHCTTYTFVYGNDISSLHLATC